MRTVALSSLSYPSGIEFDKSGPRSGGRFLLQATEIAPKPIKPKLPLSAGTDSLNSSSSTLATGAGGIHLRDHTHSAGGRTVQGEQRRARQRQTQRDPGSLCSAENQHVDQPIPTITVSHHSRLFVSFPHRLDPSAACTLATRVMSYLDAGAFSPMQFQPYVTTC